MTLRKITLHKNIVKSEKIEGQEVVETKFANIEKSESTFRKSGFYSPDFGQNDLERLESTRYEMPSHYDPNKLAKIPQGSDDSRSLLETKFSLFIEKDSQSNIKAMLVEIYNDAISITDEKFNSSSGDIGRSRYFEGIKESLFIAKKDIYADDKIITDVCLYNLFEKYENISDRFNEMIKEEIFKNSEETNYSASYHLGLASGYKNSATIIKNKLLREEANRYRTHINPSQ